MGEAAAECERVAREALGLEELRPGRLAAMTALAEGRDTLAVMPTGSGKSAIYQVPALSYGHVRGAAGARDGVPVLRARAEALGRPVIAALTATAAPPVRAEIVERLGMRDPVELVQGFDRPNISLEVRRMLDDPAPEIGTTGSWTAAWRWWSRRTRSGWASTSRTCGSSSTPRWPRRSWRPGRAPGARSCASVRACPRAA
ncbi:DEAD/DEAH box helicase [Nonomuraea coxensis]|uniref:DEAD/DEAH box helicase n=1 Tax=Nonomuraea coxensis TaxID=404386 RepID=UPI001FEC075B|nr:DEAD/DEAH box helicase [Nonomuraea coxensis]